MRTPVRIPRIRLVLLLGSLILFGSCVSENLATLDKLTTATHAPCDKGRILLRVSDQEGPELDEVQISTVTEDGIQQLLKTDFAQGNTCLDSSILKDPKVFCILFCREGYNCGALIPEKNLLEFTELKIALARRMI